MIREQENLNWIKRHLEDTYLIEWDHEHAKMVIKEETPDGARIINTYPDRYLNDLIKEQLYKSEMRLRNSKWGRDAYNTYDMNEKWFKSIKSRKSTYTKDVIEGDSVVKGVFRRDTEERIR